MDAQARLDRRIGWGLFLAAALALFLTEKPIGFVRDESQYFHAAENYARWFQLLARSPSQAFSDAATTQYWDFNHEHPGLMKSLFGLSFLLFHEGLGLVRPATAFRIPAFLMAALVLPLLYSLGRRLFGRPAGLFAAVSFLLVPRQYFNAHLACFDMPIAAMWLLVIYAFWEAQSRPRWWLYTGLFFGLALGTKHNAFFLPVVVVPFALSWAWTASRGQEKARALFLATAGVFFFGALLYGVMWLALGKDRFLDTFLLASPQTALFLVMAAVGGWLTWQLRAAHEATFRAVAPLVAMAVLGPILFYAHWPHLWHHPVDRATAYFEFHARHEHYAWFYLGTLLRQPPFPLDYVLVKTALTVPTSMLVPMVLGFGWVVVRAWRREATGLDGLLIANTLASIALISHPQVPHFGGVKHWLPSMPFLALLAAGSLTRGAKALWAWASPRVPALTEARTFALLAALVCLPALIATARVGEYGTSSYSELAGGLPGAATLGMQRQFWANNLTGVLGWINANARPGERVYLHENHGMQIGDYQRNGMLRKDLAFVNSPFDADLVAYQYHQEFREHEFNTWESLGTTRPETGLYLDETPQIIVYRRSR